MKPIIFARVADMKYYKGITDTDKPENGGSYVSDTGLAHECYNFDPIIQTDEDFEKCLGFCMMSGGKNGVNQLHIEKIVGCEACKKEDFGFGRSQVWYAGSKGASKKELDYVEKMIQSIDSYQGENWIEKEVV